MTIYLVNMALLVGWGLLLIRHEIPSRRAWFVSFATIQWIVLSGFRDVTVGADTAQYKALFLQSQTLPLGAFTDRFFEIVFTESEDPGFYLFQRLIQYVITDYQVYLVLIAMIFMIPLGYFIYKYSSEPLISFLLFSVLFYEFFAVTGLRQTVATALVVLVGYHFVRARKLGWFLLLVCIAMTIHKSSLIFVPFYFLANKQLTKAYLMTMFGVVIGLFVFRNSFFDLLVQVSGYETYSAMEGAGAVNFSLMLLSVLFMALWRKDQILANNPSAIHFFNALLLAACLLPLTFLNPSMMRLVQYFSLFLLLMIPEIVGTFERRERLVVYYSAVMLLGLLFIREAPVYSFFW
ncbi:EpsG family protein [Exiguobacterium profundum]|uniref:EpsG family protein n=1 Tax=Exiguobacterium TaxID=33986 RepID=UPI0018DAB5A0|nr:MULTISPECIES: EpsG family protein [Exiguobacterium]MCT4798288.1 EpsG family protein [Exiguobacterium profundum]MCV9900209.1 EpsG family protein [Exiguobacterium sp. N5]MDT0192458.1 EpsG family protein [Exiguobacterium sp. BG5(2022)]QPI68243.1 EpsG family protein [Exiguobacterium sp. PBE]